MNTEPLSEMSVSIDVDAILHGLVETVGAIPEAEIQQARKDAKAVTPRLVELLEQVTSRYLAGDVPADNGHLFALYLLTEFRATEAWPTVRKAMSLPGEGPFDLFGDSVTMDFARMIAVLVGDRHELVHELIADRSLNEYVRWAASDAVLHFVFQGIVAREDAIDRLIGHLRSAIENKDHEVAGCLVFSLESLAADSALPEIEQAFRDGLMDERTATLDMVAANLAEGEAFVQNSLVQLGPMGIDDTIEHLRDWVEFDAIDYEDEFESELPALFDEEPLAGEGLGQWDEEVDAWDDGPTDQTTVRRDGFRIGRNEACPCGSGKKYKKCCSRRS